MKGRTVGDVLTSVPSVPTHVLLSTKTVTMMAVGFTSATVRHGVIPLLFRSYRSDVA